MNRIVREHYPVSNLPEDLREGLADFAEVRVTVEPLETAGGGTHSVASQDGSFSARYKHLRRINFGSDTDVDAYVRHLRAE